VSTIVTPNSANAPQLQHDDGVPLQAVARMLGRSLLSATQT
jgi:hypothetical protein